MSYWLAFALIAVGFLIGRFWDRPRGKFADVDQLARDRMRASVRDC